MNTKLIVSIAFVGVIVGCTDDSNELKVVNGSATTPDISDEQVTGRIVGGPVRDGVTNRSRSLDNTVSNSWFQDAVSLNEARYETREYAGTARNIILFVGDGMGISTVTAARILDGQMKGMHGEENVLSFGEMPWSGLAKTYNVDAQTPDSAGTMTAMMTGVKTDVGVLGVDEDIVRGDCPTVFGNELTTALELAEVSGMSTGLVSTARITHATPAAAYAKSADRNWEDISDMSDGV